MSLARWRSTPRNSPGTEAVSFATTGANFAISSSTFSRPPRDCKNQRVARSNSLRDSKNSSVWQSVDTWPSNASKSDQSWFRPNTSRDTTNARKISEVPAPLSSAARQAYVMPPRLTMSLTITVEIISLRNGCDVIKSAYLTRKSDGKYLFKIS